MTFLLVYAEELSVLTGLPYIYQVAYLQGIRPYMDRKTAVVGIKRRISYQSLSEALYIEPHPGIKAGRPSREQMRRVVKGLEREGLIEIQSDDKHLILKCLLAQENNSILNKADTIPTYKTDIDLSSKMVSKSIDCGKSLEKQDIVEAQNADTPHMSENNYVYLLEKFEKFWNLYPLKSSQNFAWDVFKKLQPSDQLFEQIMISLHAQIDAHSELNLGGQWTPKWKYPSNWLMQKCWEEEINKPQGDHYAKRKTNHTKQQPIDPFWESCKGGLEYSENDGNIIELDVFRKTNKTNR